MRRDCGARMGVVLVESKISSVVKLQMLTLMRSGGKPSGVTSARGSHCISFSNTTMPSLELITNVKVN
jgi:hypothetical protein